MCNIRCIFKHVLDLQAQIKAVDQIRDITLSPTAGSGRSNCDQRRGIHPTSSSSPPCGFYCCCFYQVLFVSTFLNTHEGSIVGNSEPWNGSWGEIWFLQLFRITIAFFFFKKVFWAMLHMCITFSFVSQLVVCIHHFRAHQFHIILPNFSCFASSVKSKVSYI